MMDKENFGRFIAETRRNAGLTQKDMASKLHVTNSAVSKWERGLCYPDVTQMEALAQTLVLRSNRRSHSPFTANRGKYNLSAGHCQGIQASPAQKGIPQHSCFFRHSTSCYPFALLLHYV